MSRHIIISIVLFFLTDKAFSKRSSLYEHRKIHWHDKELNHRAPFFGQPEQIHLAYGGAPNVVTVTWLTFDDTEKSYVHFGPNMKLRSIVQSEISRFVDGGKKKTVRYIHRATINTVRPGIRYCKIISHLTGLEERTEGGYKFAVYGDLGNINARSLGKIQKEAQEGEFDMVIHNGDFAYDMFDNDGGRGDEFMRQIEPVAAYVPYMTSVGNHERKYNFSHYVNRFTMPGTDDNLYYSFDIGRAHMVVYSTEMYYWPKYYDVSHIQRQYEWLQEDLKNANRLRSQRPWIIAIGHRSMYCSDVEGHCEKAERPVREGIDDRGSFGLEELFFDMGVDLVIGAHEHNYERHWPLFNFTVGVGCNRYALVQVLNGTVGPYINPVAPVHIVTGSAGCQENTTHFDKPIAPWSVFRSSNYGFSKMQIFNQTHLYFQQDVVEDEVWVIKSRHRMRGSADKDKMTRMGRNYRDSQDRY